MQYPDYLVKDYPFPDFLRVRMNWPQDGLDDPAAAVADAMDASLPTSGITPGDSVALGIGSRGISDLAVMVRAVCDKLRDFGAEPFLLPAMGSHGGATPDGQLQVLASLGITEESIGVPVRSSLDVACIGTVRGEVPVWYSRDALDADHAICLNRIKPHTKFKGPLESGLAKMLCLGMGKHAGALAWHQWALKYGFSALLQEMAMAVLTESNLRFGIGIVENAREQVLHVEAIPADRILVREPELLAKAKAAFPRLPVRNLDVLVVREVGKEISGAGMDPNVTGRAADLMEDDFSENLKVTRIAVLRMTEQTAGNAIGIGLADFITEQVFAEMDYAKTLTNALTSVSVRKAFIPVRLADERMAIQACFTTLGPVAPEQVRAVLIRDTRHVGEFWASEVLLDELRDHPDLEVLSRSPLQFEPSGRLDLEM